MRRIKAIPFYVWRSIVAVFHYRPDGFKTFAIKSIQRKRQVALGLVGQSHIRLITALRRGEDIDRLAEACIQSLEEYLTVDQDVGRLIQNEPLNTELVRLTSDDVKEIARRIGNVEALQQPDSTD